MYKYLDLTAFTVILIYLLALQNINSPTLFQRLIIGNALLYKFYFRFLFDLLVCGVDWCD
jgi:hypothetical protein